GRDDHRPRPEPPPESHHRPLRGSGGASRLRWEGTNTGSSLSRGFAEHTAGGTGLPLDRAHLPACLRIRHNALKFANVTSFGHSQSQRGWPSTVTDYPQSIRMEPAHALHVGTQIKTEDGK